MKPGAQHPALAKLPRQVGGLGGALAELAELAGGFWGVGHMAIVGGSTCKPAAALAAMQERPWDRPAADPERSARDPSCRRLPPPAAARLSRSSTRPPAAPAAVHRRRVGGRRVRQDVPRGGPAHRGGAVPRGRGRRRRRRAVRAAWLLRALAALLLPRLLPVSSWPDPAPPPSTCCSAVAAARKAFDEGPWPRMSGKQVRAGRRCARRAAPRHEQPPFLACADPALCAPAAPPPGLQRGRTLSRLADLIEANLEELATLESLDNGGRVGGPEAQGRALLAVGWGLGARPAAAGDGSRVERSWHGCQAARALFAHARLLPPPSVHAGKPVAVARAADIPLTADHFRVRPPLGPSWLAGAGWLTGWPAGWLVGQQTMPRPAPDAASSPASPRACNPCRHSCSAPSSAAVLCRLGGQDSRKDDPVRHP